MFDKVKQSYENHIPVYLNRVTYLQQQLSSNPTEDIAKAHQDEILELTKLAIGKVNQNDLFRFLGEKQHDPSTEELKK